MTDLTLRKSSPQERHVFWRWVLGYGTVVSGGLLITALARRRFTEPFLGVSLAVVLLMLTGWLLQPRATLYATLFFTALAEQATIWWFPFTKNFSSRESIAFVADAITISPLEISLVVGCFVSMLRRYANTRTLIRRSDLNAPMIAFTALVLYGLFRGLSTGGDLRIAVIESRSIFYIAFVFVIVMNECTESVHLRTAVWCILAGVTAQSLLTIQYFQRIDRARLDQIDTLTEHASVVGQNFLLVTIAGLVLLRPKRSRVVWALMLGLVPTIYVMVVAQRRAGIAALLIGFAGLAVAVFWQRRGTFLAVAPIALVVLGGYLGAFWNSTSSVAFAAQAIKGVISPETVSAADRSSDLYRILEGYNLNATIRSSPLRGLGFGRAFYRPIALPDISSFELNAYLPHNAVLWIWIKTGFVGFATMFYLFTQSIMLGADRVRRSENELDLVVTLSATLLIMMYAVYSWVDISWSSRNTAFLGLAFAICAWETRDNEHDSPQTSLTETTSDRPTSSARFTAGV